MTEHTPGPWRVNPVYLREIVNEDGGEIATVAHWPSEHRANARLLAAAPDLLAALEAIMGDSDVTEVMNVAHWEAADAALAKARGTEDSTNA